MSVYIKLNAARDSLQNSRLKKSGQNKFAGYSYFELGDFLPTINNIFNNIGLCGVVSFTSELATLTITDVDDKSQIVITSPMGSAALKGCHEVQNIGAVETYQRRYLWVTAMEIVEHDALDAISGADDVPLSRAVKTPTINMQTLIKQITDTKSLDELLKAFQDVYPKTKNDPEATKQIIAAKDEMKSLFEGESK